MTHWTVNRSGVTKRLCPSYLDEQPDGIHDSSTVARLALEHRYKLHMVPLVPVEEEVELVISLARVTMDTKDMMIRTSYGPSAVLKYRCFAVPAPSASW